MKYRSLGSTGLAVSEIGLGTEWLERRSGAEVKAVIELSESCGINIQDCWMSEPNVRTNISAAIAGRRENWIIQGHMGSTWQNSQYVRSRDMEKVQEAFSDLLVRLGTDYLDLGMIHYADEATDYHTIMNGAFIEYARGLKKNGVIRHLGMSTHNPAVAKMAALSGEVEAILFSINPAFDLLPATEDINVYFAEEYDASFCGVAPEHEDLYRICEQRGVSASR